MRALVFSACTSFLFACKTRNPELNSAGPQSITLQGPGKQPAIGRAVRLRLKLDMLKHLVESNLMSTRDIGQKQLEEVGKIKPVGAEMREALCSKEDLQEYYAIFKDFRPRFDGRTLHSPLKMAKFCLKDARYRGILDDDIKTGALFIAMPYIPQYLLGETEEENGADGGFFRDFAQYQAKFDALTVLGVLSENDRVYWGIADLLKAWTAGAGQGDKEVELLEAIRSQYRERCNGGSKSQDVF